ncbi:MAG: hypothetical protein AAGL90_02385 [Pseudomonadota bacterium]
MERKKPLLSKRARRYLGAAIATAVTTFIAMSTIYSAKADTCNLHDAMSWQQALSDPEIEQTPEYIRFITEAFLNACPARPEVFEARRIAGMAAADMGDPKAAAQHFADAGPMSDKTANFYAISALLAIGQDRQAWQLRDQMIAAWHRRLDRHPDVFIAKNISARGTIYEVYFSRLDRNSNTSRVWVAVPNGPGWPASLAISKERLSLAMHRIRAGTLDAQTRFVDLNRCGGRHALGQISGATLSEALDPATETQLRKYLQQPDKQVPRDGARIRPCLWPARLLPGVPKG